MGRLRTIVAVTILIAVMGLVLFWAVVITYTLFLGEKATARVETCYETGSGRNSELTCTGSWTTADSQTHSGEIYGLEEQDAGRVVMVRLGPMGPYAQWNPSYIGYYLMLVPVILVSFATIRVRRYLCLSSRRPQDRPSENT
jgi:hypothetical protein